MICITAIVQEEGGFIAPLQFQIVPPELLFTVLGETCSLLVCYLYVFPSGES